MIKIAECNSPEEILATYKVMSQLRPHLNEAGYVDLIQSMFKEGFRLIGLFEHGHCLGAMGFRVETRLVNGKMIYIDDLVIDEAGRSKGLGKQLLDWVKAEAKQLSVHHIFLDSGTHRHSAHKFYLREGFHIFGFNFLIKLENS